jgi:hypothetical protein
MWGVRHGANGPSRALTRLCTRAAARARAATSTVGQISGVCACERDTKSPIGRRQRLRRVMQDVREQRVEYELSRGEARDERHGTRHSEDTATVDRVFMLLHAGKKDMRATITSCR